jgi:protein gp37
MNPEWAVSLRDQCQRAGVPFLFKKNSSGTRELEGREWNEYPEAIR